MATYTKNGMRKAKVNNTNNALKQIRNFGNILESMEKLNREIENYDGVITESNLDSICNLINLEKKLNLTSEQIKIVQKKYE